MRIRQNTGRALMAVAVVAAGLAAAACAPDSQPNTLFGTIVDDTISLAAPVLPVPAPNVSAGVATGGDQAADIAQRPQWASSVATMTGLGRVVRVASVPVEVGDTVEPGQVVATLDAGAFAADVRAAEAAAGAAKARVGVLEQRLDDVAGNRADLADARAEVLDTLGTIRANRADLTSRLSEARAQLRELEAAREKLRQLQARPPSVPATLPPGVTPPPGAGGQLPPGVPDPAELDRGIARLKAGIAQLESGLAKLDEGLGKARSGLADIADARAKTADATDQLENARDLAKIAADASGAAVEIAKVRRELTVLRAPERGVVVKRVEPGETLVPGAAVVVIRPDRTSEVEVWMPPERREAVALGDSATVRIDSRPGEEFPASVSLIGERQEYPPTRVATQEVHLTRAIRVRVTLDDSAERLPVGTPADVDVGAADASQ